MICQYLKWCSALFQEREKLQAHPRNSALLHDVESAVFHVVLEDTTPEVSLRPTDGQSNALLCCLETARPKKVVMGTAVVNGSHSKSFCFKHSDLFTRWAPFNFSV